MTGERVVCLGEALVDLVPGDDDGRTWRALPGGAPYNAAIAAARLGAPTTFLGVLSEDRFGNLLRRHLDGSGVVHDHCPTVTDPTALAVVDGEDFAFHVSGTNVTSQQVNDIHLPADLSVLHVSGSVALVVEPAASRLEALVAAAQHRALIVADANPRPHVIGRDRYLRRFGHWLGTADIVKVSLDDVAWMSPGADAVATARHWVSAHEEGEAQVPGVVIVTRGSDGAVVVRADGTVEVDAPEVDVVDTVGAGDVFSGAVLAALAAHGIASRDALDALPLAWWQTAATYAVEAASLSCTRRGADPPRRGELRARGDASR